MFQIEQSLISTVRDKNIIERFYLYAKGLAAPKCKKLIKYVLLTSVLLNNYSLGLTNQKSKQTKTLNPQ